MGSAAGGMELLCGREVGETRPFSCATESDGNGAGGSHQGMGHAGNRLSGAVLPATRGLRQGPELHKLLKHAKALERERRERTPYPRPARRTERVGSVGPHGRPTPATGPRSHSRYPLGPAVTFWPSAPPRCSPRVAHPRSAARTSHSSHGPPSCGRWVRRSRSASLRSDSYPSAYRSGRSSSGGRGSGVGGPFVLMRGRAIG